MNSTDATLTTGLPELDTVLKGVLRGDNIVWRIDSIDDYRELVMPFCRAALQNGHRLIYFHYAHHPELITESEGAEVYTPSSKQGFEHFIGQIHSVIESAGPGTFYVFDCLSCLAIDWYSDEMLGNFFTLTCPHLFDLEAVSYFALCRNQHTTRAIAPIQNTTQLFVDVYRHKDDLYVRPIKTLHRYSSTMNMLHVQRESAFIPVTSSAIISEILTSTKWSGLHSDNNLGFWEASFIQAREWLSSGEYRSDLPENGQKLYDRLVRMVISRDAGMLDLIARYLSLRDILDIRKRMIGTGLIGGKAVGMLLAGAIVKKSDERLAALLEAQDSFFVGSDTFFSFLVSNGIWWIRQNQRHQDKFLEGADEARRRIITGTFPEHILKQFDEMLDYFGQSPFIVRSSSLLEDNFGNSFAGKYESVFCVNQGPRARRMQDFLAAVKRIYASSMSEQALRYRARRGMLEQDEQMALLVMRVSGTMHGRRFYPEMAGVGFSFNPYAWHESIDPRAGVIRLVFGMGTRAVDQADDDHTRIIALNAPDKRPEANFDEVAQYTQRRVDYLDLEANQLVSGAFETIAAATDQLALEIYTDVDRSLPRGAPTHRILTFKKLIEQTTFVRDLRALLDTIETAYNHPVDIEFTANFLDNDDYRINLLQCRPLQAKGSESIELPKVAIPAENRIVEARGAVVGQSRIGPIGRLIYIVPERYAQLPVHTRYEIARLIGEINRAERQNAPENVMLIGPGRWGTSSPSLGIPVSFHEINTVTILCEVVAMHETLVPDVSLGTHFLNELVELDMLYLALFPNRGENYLNTPFFEQSDNQLLQLVPSAQKWADTVRVIDPTQPDEIRIIADAIGQTVRCYRAPRE